MIHPLAWLAWLAALLVMLSTTRNPWYLGLILAWITGVSLAARPEAAGNSALPLSPLRFAVGVVPISALFNALTVHFGATILWTLPEALPLLGGPITLEALVYGALNGLILTGLFAAFSLVNQALAVREIVRLIPRAFFSIAVAVSIALTFAPLTLRQFEQIRAAQAVRGHRLRGLRDGLPLLLPLLIGGLERALQLAEAMTARGFAGTAAPAGETTTKLVLIVGLASVTAGWLLRLVWGQAVWGLLLMGAGAGLITGRLWWLGRRTRPTVYRPTPWTKRDESVVLGAALAALALAWPWPDLDRSSIFYYPYPQLTWPTCHPLLALATMGLLLPAVWRYRHKPAPLASPYPLADPEQR